MKKFLAFLHKHGLASTIVNETEALDWARNGNLSSELLAQLNDLCVEDGVKFDITAATPKRSATTATRSGSEPTALATGREPTALAAGANDPQRAQTPVTVDPGQAARDAVAAERARIAAIRQLHIEHPEVPAAVVAECETRGDSVEQATSAFLTALRTSRQPGVPAIHARGGQQLSIRSLQAALLERCGITPDSAVLRHEVFTPFARRREFGADWLANVPQSGQRRDEMEQAFDIARQRGLGHLSLMRAAEMMIELETGERLYDEQEVMQRAFSSANFSAVFGAVVHMQLLASYAATPATYQEFCDVVEVGDFREHKDADMGQVGPLKKQGKNGAQAALLNVADPELLSIAAERYAGMLEVSDQTFIQDAFGVTGMLPSELGQTCQQLPIDLAYAQVLSTATLPDGRTRYNVDDDNTLDVADFDEEALTSMGVKLKAKKVGARRIAVNGSVLICGVTQSPTVRKYTQSATINEANNPHVGQYRTVEDTAVDLGVDDPANDYATIAGTPNSVYAFTGGPKRSVTVAFRRGTNRGPVIRSGMMMQGKWGMYWDVFMDVGAKFRRRVGTVRVRVTG